MEAEQSLLATVPTTREELLAYIDTIAADIVPEVHLGPDEITTVLKTIATAMRSV